MKPGERGARLEAAPITCIQHYANYTTKEKQLTRRPQSVLVPFVGESRCQTVTHFESSGAKCGQSSSSLTGCPRDLPTSVPPATRMPTDLGQSVWSLRDHGQSHPSSPIFRPTALQRQVQGTPHCRNLWARAMFAGVSSSLSTELTQKRAPSQAGGSTGVGAADQVRRRKFFC